MRNGDILSNWRQKRVYLFCVIWNFIFSFFVLNLGTMQNMHNESVAALWHYTIVVVAPELKTYSSNIKR